MKVTWEEKDVHTGRKVKITGSNEVLVIGYSYDAKGKKLLHLVSLSDGLVWSGQPSKADMAAMLTENECTPADLVLA